MDSRVHNQTVPDRSVTTANHEFSNLLRGDAESLRGWLHGGDRFLLGRDLAVIFIGSGCYGAAMGWWRSPEQALFVAIKFPLIILLVTLGNAVLNAMLAPLLGLNLTLRQSLRAVLMSFTISAAILGAFSPLAAFMVWNAPPLAAAEARSTVYGFIKLTHVLVIAFAGIVGNARLFRLLVSLAGGDRKPAWRVLAAWLAVNLFLGSQLSWVLRPFIGTPFLPVQFLRPEIALQGNFYENVFQTVLQLLPH
jgi:hypothetical protein